MSILNTLVWRGLPTERTLAAPAVTESPPACAAADPFLGDAAGVILLGEVACLAVAAPRLTTLPGVPYQYQRAARLHLAGEPPRQARGRASGP